VKLLRINSSARSRSSVSRRLTSYFVEEWKKQNPDGQVIDRDLALTPLPHITDEFPASASEASTTAQQQYLSTSDALIAELFAADIVVIGAPMYNFTVSWELKAWIDQIVRLGKSVAYGPNGPTRPGFRKESYGHHFSRRSLSGRHSASRVRFPRAILTPHSPLHWNHGRAVHSRRKPISP
jgi:FMN-dependent NADH-azoreductase